jgi:transposase-like protein
MRYSQFAASDAHVTRRGDAKPDFIPIDPHNDNFHRLVVAKINDNLFTLLTGYY